MEIDKRMMLKEFLNQLQNLDDGTISLDELLGNDKDRAIYEKWIEVFNVMNPMDIIQGLNTVNNVFKMSKRDEIILLAYIKFFEQKLKHLREGVESYGHLFGQHKVSKKDFDGDMYA